MNTDHHKPSISPALPGIWTFFVLVGMIIASPFTHAQSINAPPEQSSSTSSNTRPLMVEGKPPTTATVTMGSSDPMPSDLARSPMLSQLLGIARELNARAINTLRKEMSELTELELDSQPFAIMRLTRGKATHDISIHRIDQRQLAFVNETDPESNLSQAWTVDAEVFESIGLNQAMLADIEKQSIIKPLRSDTLEQPYFESDITLDSRTRRARFKQNYPQLTRELHKERIRIRLPQGDSSDQDNPLPPGLLVWISPTPNGQIPRIFAKACDELNLIAIGVDNNGNEQQITDRLQNHLDSIATVAAKFQIDERRIYATGMSGGGRCTSIFQQTFPEIFMGSVPIVGLDSYHKTPTGNPGLFWEARFGRPSAQSFKLLKDRRIAAITGSMDFNAPEMKTRSQQMKRDGLNIRLDIIEGMGHTMPDEDQFLDALAWVDEMQQEQIAVSNAKAQKSLDQYTSRNGNGVAEDSRSRRQLIQITIDAPWSPSAWEAAKILGIEIDQAPDD